MQLVAPQHSIPDAHVSFSFSATARTAPDQIRNAGMPGVHLCFPLLQQLQCSLLASDQIQKQKQEARQTPFPLVRALWQATGELVFVEIGDGSPGDLPQLLRTALAHLKV